MVFFFHRNSVLKDLLAKTWTDRTEFTMTVCRRRLSVYPYRHAVMVAAALSNSNSSSNNSRLIPKTTRATTPSSA